MKHIDRKQLMNEVETAYFAHDGRLSQVMLYDEVAKSLNLNPSVYVGKVGAQTNVNLFYRAVRWCQQSLRQRNLLIQVEKGVWELTGPAKAKLQVIEAGKKVLAMSTRLGIIICGNTEAVFGEGIIDEDVHLVLTSPPYILQNARHYGGPSEAKEWVEFMLKVLRPIIPRLADGASIALNVGQDSFHKGMPARMTHLERLTLALEDEGLWLVDRLIWHSNKAPGPYPWTSLQRQMLKSSYEYVLHFTNNPLKLRSNNQRVLLPHSEQHIRFVEQGGTRNAAINSDGAHRKSVGDYSNTDLTKGKLASNVLYFSNKCRHNEQVNRFAREHGLPTHGAKMPFKLAEFLVHYLSRPGDFVIDCFAGTSTVGEACEVHGRRFVMIERIKEYIQQSFVRFQTLTDDIWINPAFRLAA